MAMKAMSAIRVVPMIVACSLSTTALRAQLKPTSGDAATKVAAINVRQAIVSTAEGKQASAQLDAEFSARRKELEALSKQIHDIQQRLTAGANTLSDEEKERLTLQGRRLAQKLDRKQNEFQEDLNNAQTDVLDRIGRKLVDVVGRYAKTKGYSAVLDNSARSTPLLYASTDIMQDIVRLYDETYPIKNGVAGVEAKPEANPNAKPSGR
jgi:outer membrane protein